VECIELGQEAPILGVVLLLVAQSSPAVLDEGGHVHHPVGLDPLDLLRHIGATHQRLVSHEADVGPAVHGADVAHLAADRRLVANGLPASHPL